jgi:hypothetical protein
MKRKAKSFVQHKLNGLRLFCRLRPILGKRVAAAVTKAWERCFLYRLIYAQIGEWLCWC